MAQGSPTGFSLPLPSFCTQNPVWSPAVPGKVMPFAAGRRPGSPSYSLRRPHIAVQIQPHGSHCEVLQAAPPPRKFPLHLRNPSLITGIPELSGQRATQQRGSSVAPPKPGELTSSSKLMKPRA